MSLRSLSILAFLLLLSACASKEPARFDRGSHWTGYASWYGKKFHGRKTASGEIYDMHQRTAAHRSAPFGTLLRVTHLENGRSTTVRINDRGPFIQGRVIDLSYQAAKDLDLLRSGTARVRLEVIQGSQASSEVSSQGANIFIQIGSFTEARNADEMISKARRSFPSERFQVRKEADFFRVWMGPYAENHAYEKLRRLKEGGFQGFILQR